MAKITSANAWANNEVAYVAWDTDGKIPGCLGFEVTRVYLDAAGNVAKRPDGSDDRVKCAAWVAFKGQRNPDWLPQDTGVWPVQKFSWRDLTLRKKRDGMTRRPDEVTVRYEIRPVGDLKPGLIRCAVQRPREGDDRQARREGEAHHRCRRQAGEESWAMPTRARRGRWATWLPPSSRTRSLVTSKRPPFRSTFTNGILAAQWLSNVLNEDGVIEKNELIDKISDPDDPHRKYLAGDVLPLLHELFCAAGQLPPRPLRAGGRGAREAHPRQQGPRRRHPGQHRRGRRGDWDARNAPARKRLRAALGARLQDRMFNNSIHIGHNKFVVHLDPAGTPQAVFTGSTNWTSTGRRGPDQQRAPGRGRGGGQGLPRLLAAHARRRQAAASPSPSSPRR